VIVGLFYLEVTVAQPAWFLFADVPGFLVVRPAPGNLFLIMDRPSVANTILLVQQRSSRSCSPG
jgi:hypothetical protein